MIQQYRKEMSKRTAVMPTDPKFDLQWSLVSHAGIDCLCMDVIFIALVTICSVVI